MKTIIKNLKLEDVGVRLDMIAKSESIICNSPLIYTDMYVSLDTFCKQFKSDSKPREWYFAIRENGTEADERREYVIQRCSDLGAAHLAIKVEYNSTLDSYTMTIKRQ